MRTRLRLVIPAAAIAVIAAGCGGPHRPGSASAPTRSPPLAGPPAPLPGHGLLARPGFSVVAVARRGYVRLYRQPGAAPLPRVQRSPDPRFPLILLVRRSRPGWLQVRLPVRPNQSMAWIHESEVTVRYDPFRILVSLGRHRLLLWRGNQLIVRERIGVGRVVTPTPHGLYYIIQLFRLTDPGGPYGPYALGLSAYSNVLQSFGTGPGQIAIHGTNDPGGIGSNVSHGCIHVTNPEITRLARLLPLGTPVSITA
jgi:lipoprotein-anchoring transpeptidase ErfK/SrfK